MKVVIRRTAGRTSRRGWTERSRGGGGVMLRKGERPATRARAWAAAAAGLALAGCLAQEADLRKVNADLDAKIRKLDQREQEIQKQVNEATKQIKAESEKAERLVYEARARLNQDITALREADLPGVLGGVERNEHQIKMLRERLEDLEHRAAQDRQHVAAAEKALKEQAAAQQAERDRAQQESAKLLARLDAVQGALAALAPKVEARLQEHDRAIEEERAEVAALSKQLQQEMVKLTRALEGFKQAMNDLGEKVVQQERKDAERVALLSQRTDELAAKVNGDAKATTEYLVRVEKNYATLVEGLKNLTHKVQLRLDQQEQRLGEAARASEALKGDLSQVIRQVNERMQEQDRQVEGLGKGLQGLDERLRGLSAASAGAPPSPGPAASTPVEGAETAQGGAALAAVEGATLAVTTPPSAPTRAAPPPDAAPAPSDRRAYDEAMTRYKQGDFARAQQGFALFLTQYPTSALAGNAQFWLGECYYKQKKFQRAVEAYDRVQSAYPTNEKVPAALLKKGHAYLALKERERAYQTWKQLVDAYPKSPEAGKALDGLKQVNVTP